MSRIVLGEPTFVIYRKNEFILEDSNPILLYTISNTPDETLHKKNDLIIDKNFRLYFSHPRTMRNENITQKEKVFSISYLLKYFPDFQILRFSYEIFRFDFQKYVFCLLSDSENFRFLSPFSVTIHVMKKYLNGLEIYTKWSIWYEYCP